jgi:hypothetical protein
MGVAHTSRAPSWCPTCQADTGTLVDLAKSAQMMAYCAKCKGSKVAGALSQPLAAVGKLLGEEDVTTVPLARAEQQDISNVRKLPVREAGAPPRRPVSAHTSAEDIVEEARAQVARLDAEIPALEAELARARQHRKGLAKMVAAYDRGVAKRIVDPGPPDTH